LFPNYSWNDEVKEDEMGRACSMKRGEVELMHGINGNSKGKETTGKTKT
jgi:hypothetical protein